MEELQVSKVDEFLKDLHALINMRAPEEDYKYVYVFYFNQEPTAELLEEYRKTVQAIDEDLIRKEEDSYDVEDSYDSYAGESSY